MPIAMTARVGRTTKRTPALQAALCSVLAAGGTRRAACAHVGVDHTQFYRWLERDAPFRTAVEKAEADAELRFTTIIVTAASESWQAAAWWLERRRYADFGRKDRIEVDIRSQAQAIAQSLGLDADELVATAEAILRAQA
jgi:hypothetical protein